MSPSILFEVGLRTGIVTRRRGRPVDRPPIAERFTKKIINRSLFAPKLNEYKRVLAVECKDFDASPDGAAGGRGNLIEV